MLTADQSVLMNDSGFSQSHSDTSEDDDFKTGYALIIISIAIIIGNSLVLLTVKSLAKRLVADIFISSLALLDIIHTVTSILIAIIFKWTSLHHSQSKKSEFKVLCSAQAWFTVTIQVQNAFTVTIINLERLMAVSRPFFYKSYVNTNRAVKILGILMIVSICVSSLPFFCWGEYGLLPKMALCLFPQDSHYAIFIVSIGYADFLVVSYCFFAIRVSLNKFMKRQARFAARRGAIVELQAQGGDSTRKITKTASTSILQSQRLLKVTAMISGLFYFSWLPLMIAITRAQVTEEPSYVLNLMATLQPLASPLVNPLIYFFSWERYKKNYIKIMKRLVCCRVRIFDEVATAKKTVARGAEILGEYNEEGDRLNGNIEQLSNRLQPEILQRKNLPILERKPRSYSYDNSIQCSTISSNTPTIKYNTKRRHTIGALSESSFFGKPFSESENVPSNDTVISNRHVEGKHLCFPNSDNLKERFALDSVENKHRYPSENSLGNEKLKKRFRKVPKSWLKMSQQRSFENDQISHTNNECLTDNFLGDCMQREMEEELKLKDYVPERKVTEKKITEGNQSKNLSDPCLITQRISQYLTNVMSEQNFQESHNERKGSRISELAKREGTRTKLRNPYDFSLRKDQEKRHISRQRIRALYSRNRFKYSRKNYWDEFDDFRKSLEDDQKARKSEEETKSFENNERIMFKKSRSENNFQEMSDNINDKGGRKTCEKYSNQLTSTNFPKTDEDVKKKRTRTFRQYSRHYGNRNTERFAAHGDSRKRKIPKIRKELKEDMEASIWTYL